MKKTEKQKLIKMLQQMQDIYEQTEDLDFSNLNSVELYFNPALGLCAIVVPQKGKTIVLWAGSKL